MAGMGQPCFPSLCPGTALLLLSPWLPVPGARQAELLTSPQQIILSLIPAASQQFHWHRSIPRNNKKRTENFRSVHAICFPVMILGDLWEAQCRLPPCCGFRPLPGSKNIHLIHRAAVGKAELLIPRDGWRFSLYQSESRDSLCCHFPV